MKAFLDSLSTSEIAILAALVSAIIAAIVSVLTTRYTVKHGPNYGEQIKGLHETMGALARTQEEFRQQQANLGEEERERHTNQEKRAELARWKPDVTLSSIVEGNQQVNKLSLKSIRSFCLLEVSLMSSTGAKVFDYPMNKPIGCSTGFGVPITQESLNMIANSSQTFFQHSYFDATFRYRATLESGDGSEFTGELPFRAQQTFVANTCFYKLTG